MNGTDFPALAQVLEEETGIPAFAVPTNGMHDYVYGAGIALEEIAKRFTGEKTGRIQARTVNLLGVTPLDFGPVSHVEVLKENLKACGWKVLSTWAMGDELDAFLQAGEAEVNLVVSSVGLRAAKCSEESSEPVCGWNADWFLYRADCESTGRKRADAISKGSDAG